MHPALSIIVFTTLSGLGYGLAAVLGLGVLDPAAPATKLAWVAALLLIAGGLLSSTLHLGNPQRAWRALSQWRSSWLSREGVMAILTLVPLSVSALATVWAGRHLIAVGLVGAAMCAITVYCTSMIYASLRSVLAWNTRLTSACFLLFSLAGGFILSTLTATAGGEPTRWVALAAALATAAAWMAKHFWWRRLDTLEPLSTPETATGLGTIGRVRLFERPHINDNYLTREMGFQVARKHTAKLRRIALISGGVVPALLLLLVAGAGGSGPSAVVAAAPAAALHFIGVLVERWLFFAEAKHAVMNYY
jgi:DMSO reductase anchor subunit